MIVASLLVIFFMVGLLFNHQYERNKNQVHSQNVLITRILSELPIDDLMQSGNLKQLLKIIRSSQDHGTFAYAVVVNEQGEILAQDAALDLMLPDFIIDDRSIADTNRLKQGERSVTLTGQDRLIDEYYATLSTHGETRATVHLGRFPPPLSISREQIVFFAILSLPIFLLTPLFNFLVRREIRPLAKVSAEVENYLSGGQLERVDMRASGELSEIMQNISTLFKHTQGQMKNLESQLQHHNTLNKLLSYQRARIENVLQAVPDGLLILDEGGKITYSNSKADSYLGADNETIKTLEPKVWCQDQEITSYLHQCVGRSGVAFTASSVIYSPQNDPEKKIQLNAYPLFSAKEEHSINGTLVSLRDVTQEYLERQSRGDFVAHVSHELKSPLTVMKLYVESLQDVDGQDEAFRVDAINVMSDEVDRMTMLINNLLSITQMEMGAMNLETKRVRIHDLLQDALNSVSRSAKEKHIQFNSDVNQNLGAVDIDKDLMRVAINNLLTNAIKYNRDNGEVTVTAEESQAGLTISIKDTGIGISEEDQAQIFEKFFRSSDSEANERGGQGLGLTLARDIVRLHNGNLTLNSVLGEGTEFIIELKKSMVKLEQAS